MSSAERGVRLVRDIFRMPRTFRLVLFASWRRLALHEPLEEGGVAYSTKTTPDIYKSYLYTEMSVKAKEC